jgi:hypothetical protein
LRPVCWSDGPMALPVGWFFSQLAAARIVSYAAW